jgi:hypothetical protein
VNSKSVFANLMSNCRREIGLSAQKVSSQCTQLLGICNLGNWDNAQQFHHFNAKSLGFCAAHACERGCARGYSYSVHVNPQLRLILNLVCR